MAATAATATAVATAAATAAASFVKSQLSLQVLKRLFLSLLVVYLRGNRKGQKFVQREVGFSTSLT